MQMPEKMILHQVPVQNDFQDGALLIMSFIFLQGKLKKRFFSFAGMMFILCAAAFCELTAAEVMDNATYEDNARKAVTYIQDSLKKITVSSEKRSLYAFLGSLQEQLLMYREAASSYATAAGISAVDAAGMPKKTAEQLVLDAIRCSLCYGDTVTCDSYLNSAVRDSREPLIQAYVKLYDVWNDLCKMQDTARIDEQISLLRAYSNMESMKPVWPSVLLTLWYITGEGTYESSIKSLYPSSPEAAIVQGKVQMLPAPFWFFMPKKGNAIADAVENAVESQKVSVEKDTVETTVDSGAIKKQQIGLFRSRENAQNLCNKLKDKGFTGYIITETKPSGNVYYLVVVDENSQGTMGNQLRSAGFECYPLF